MEYSFKDIYDNEKTVYETQRENKRNSLHKVNHESLMNFLIRIDALVAEFKCGDVKNDFKIISLIGLSSSGDIYIQFISYVSV